MEKVSFIYAAFVFMSVTNGCLATLYADTKSVIIGNSTIVEKPLIISTWFPFDKNEHYWVRPFSLTGALKKSNVLTTGGLWPSSIRRLHGCPNRGLYRHFNVQHDQLPYRTTDQASALSQEHGRLQNTLWGLSHIHQNRATPYTHYKVRFKLSDVISVFKNW